MTNLYETYKALRAKYPDDSAKWAAHYARRKPNGYLKSLPYSDKPERVDVPGVGHLLFELIPDDYHDAWEDQKSEWRRSDGEWLRNFGSSRGGWYTLNHWDHGSCLVIKLDTSVEDVAAYHHKRGASKQVAREAAYKSIRSSLRYWYDVATGEISFYGYRVRLFDKDGREVDEDSCWGFDVDWTGNSEYIVEQMNYAGRYLVKKYRREHRFADAMANAL